MNNEKKFLMKSAKKRKKLSSLFGHFVLSLYIRRQQIHVEFMNHFPVNHP
jgi:hypothetical protein